MTFFSQASSNHQDLDSLFTLQMKVDTPAPGLDQIILRHLSDPTDIASWSLWWLGITRRERIGAMRNRREMAKLQRWCTRRDHLREAALQGKLRKRAGYVWYLIGERTAASQAAWRWSESCSLFQSSDRHKAQNYYHYSVQLHPLVSSNRLEPYSQLIHRCTLRIESPDPILSNGATAQTASLNQQHLRPEILFCLSCLFPSICLILLMSKGRLGYAQTATYAQVPYCVLVA